jgi:hypothetical protein
MKKKNVMGYKFPLRPSSWSRRDMRRTRQRPKRGDNIRFLATYLFEHPGASSGECRKALCEENGIEWEGSTQMRGQYTSYFTVGAQGAGWSNPPLGRYWTRIKKDRGTGYMLTIEGMGWVDVDRAFSGAA